jgi:streptogramin lyase
VIGGPVVHDTRLPQLAGRYLWTDYCDRTVYAVDPSQKDPVATVVATFAGQPTSFGVDGANRVYLTTATGQLYRLDPS